MNEKKPFLEELDESFLTMLDGEDALGVVIRTHLHVENALMRIISASFTNKGVLKDEDLTYEIKVKLSIAIGLRPELLGVLNCLGGIRNKFGHNLDEDLSKDKMDALFKAFPKNDQATIKNIFHSLSEQMFQKFAHHYELDPKVRLALYAIALREMLRVALSQQAEV